MSELPQVDARPVGGTAFYEVTCPNCGLWGGLWWETLNAVLRGDDVLTCGACRADFTVKAPPHYSKYLADNGHIP